MTQVRKEIEGRIDEVVRILQQFGGRERDATGGVDVGPIGTLDSGDEDAAPPTCPERVVASREAVPGQWTKDLVTGFLGDLEPTARRMALQVWRAGAAGIHRSTLCQHSDLTPAELRSLLIQMNRQLRRFQQEQRVMLSRPVVSNRPRQGYFVDADFAAAANACMFGD